MVTRAQNKKRLPLEAKAVMDEIVVRLRKAIRETAFQREDRLEKEYHILQMGNRTHAEFRAQFEMKLDEMEDAGMHLDVGALRRNYLSKLTDDLRQAVLHKSWELDGPNTKRTNGTSTFI